MRRLLVALLFATVAASARPLVVTVDQVVEKGASSLEPALSAAWLKALAKHKVPAVLFVAGAQLDGGAEALRRWVAAGHEVGTLGQRGQPMVRDPLANWSRDLDAGRSGLVDLLSQPGRGRPVVRWYRFPGLAEGQTQELLGATREHLRTQKLQHLDATVDRPYSALNADYRAAQKAKKKGPMAEASADWLAAMRAFVKRAESLGDKLVDGEAPQILRLDLDAIGAANVDALLGWLERRGYTFVRPAEVLDHPLFARPHEYTGARGVSLFWRLRVSADTRNAVKDVSEALFAASAAWSRGDLEGYLKLYADDARVVSGRDIVEGRGALSEKYRARYPTAAAMGRLGIKVVRLDVHTADRESLFGQVEPLPPRFALVTAEWTLEPQGERARAGLASLVFRKSKRGWKLIEDHSSTGVYMAGPKPRAKPSTGKPPKARPKGR